MEIKENLAIVLLRRKVNNIHKDIDTLESMYKLIKKESETLADWEKMISDLKLESTEIEKSISILKKAYQLT